MSVGRLVEEVHLLLHCVLILAPVLCECAAFKTFKRLSFASQQLPPPPEAGRTEQAQQLSSVAANTWPLVLHGTEWCCSRETWKAGYDSDFDWIAMNELWRMKLIIDY